MLYGKQADASQNRIKEVAFFLFNISMFIQWYSVSTQLSLEFIRDSSGIFLCE